MRPTFGRHMTSVWKLKITFSAGRGKVDIGGVRSHPGKVTLRNVYGRDHDQIRERIRALLIQNLVTDKRDFAQNQVFEKYIDVVPSKDRATWNGSSPWTVYIYFTKKELAARGSTIFHGSKLFDAPMNIYAFKMLDMLEGRSPGSAV